MDLLRTELKTCIWIFEEFRKRYKMGHVIFAEGKNDVCFVRSLMEGREEIDEVEEFLLSEYLKTHGGGLLIPEETKKIRKFIALKNPNDMLVKSEGSKSSLLKTFSTLIVDMCQFNTRFSLIIDQDGSDVDHLINRINGHIGSQYLGSVVVSAESRVEITQRISHTMCIVRGSNGLSDEFSLISFEPDLEEAACVNKANSRDTIEETISDYIDENPEFEELAGELAATGASD